MAPLLEPVSLPRQIEAKIPVLMSNLDRDAVSRTFGCFDRQYWGWKFKDMPDATLQRCIYPLVRFFKNADQLNGRRIPWITGAFAFTRGLQHRDGSFDQAFPREHSHGATAFLLFDLACAFRLAGDRLNPEDRSANLDMLCRMGRYLCRYDELHGMISNHLLGAAAGLAVLENLTGDRSFGDRAAYYTERVLSRADDDGWWGEYGGADPGYQTLALYYLAHYADEKGTDDFDGHMRKVVEFSSYFIHPDGSFGGEYGSRNTQVFYPGGFALLAGRIPAAAGILSYMRSQIECQSTVSLLGVDPGNVAPVMNNYLDVVEKEGDGCPEDTAFTLPLESSPFTRVFQSAGLIVHNTDDRYTVIGAAKGGVVKSFDKTGESPVLMDCGYLGSLKNGTRITAQHQGNGDFTMAGSDVVITCRLYLLQQPVPTPVNYIALRIINMAAGWSGVLRELTKKIMVLFLLKNKPCAGLRMKRTISLEGIPRITDTVIPPDKNGTVRQIDPGGPYTSIHMASSKYWSL